MFSAEGLRTSTGNLRINQEKNLKGELDKLSESFDYGTTSSDQL